MPYSNQPPVIRRPLLDAQHLVEVARQLMFVPEVILFGFLPGHDFNIRRREAEQRAQTLDALRAVGENQHITPATEWLIDNHHVISEAYRHLHRDLNARFLRSLPKVQVAGNGAIPRAFALGWEYVALSDSHLGEASLAEFVKAAQGIDWLTIGELWALPSMLRFVLLENILRLSRRTHDARMDRLRANADADRLLGVGEDAGKGVEGKGADDFDRIVLDEHLRRIPYAAQLIYRLHDGFSSSAATIARLSERLAAFDLTPEKVLADEQMRQASGTITAGNIIRSLRWIDEHDWQEWFEAFSRVEALLHRDPDHARLSPETRNAVRDRIEMISRHSPHSQFEIAERVVDWAQARGEISSSVLLGPLRAGFEREQGYRRPLRERIVRAASRGGIASFVIPTILITAAMLALAALVIPPGYAHALRFLLLLLFLPAAYDVARALVTFIAVRLLPPLVLPSFGFKEGIPEEERTLVVIPCLLTDFDTIDDLTDRLEAHWLANPDRALHFALLTDWTDAAEETVPRDAEMLARARQCIDHLAEKYAHTGHRFYLLHRKRQWNPQEGVWMGWERKRGKLAELNLLLRGANDTSFMDTGPRPPEGIRYVVTLDADTRMPRDTVRALVGMMAHPVNRPVYDAAARRVVRGHGLIQPRVSPSLTVGHEASIFQRISSRERGLDQYMFPASDLYQDLLDQGTYTGKGIYEVDAFTAAAEPGIRENSVLSHDLIEGAWLRAALASNAQLIEDYPQRFDVDLARQHRWARGDWQLLPYLLDPRNGLDALARYRMLDNMRRSLMPALLLLAGLIGVLTMAFGDALLWLSLLALPVGLAQLMEWAMGLVPREAGVPLARHVAVTVEELFGEIVAFLLRVALLPQMAWSLGDAIARSLYRTYVSHRKMLEWTPVAEVRRSRSQLAGMIWRMRGGCILALAVLVLVLVFAPSNIMLIAGLVPLWLAAPVIAWVTSLPLHSEENVPLNHGERQEWRSAARLIWRYFETFVTAENNHLPPDNYQDEPAPKLATRTSPTNIGLYLLSVVSAREFHWISLAEALDRIEATLGTVARMEHYRGHLFNWYATDTLEPLLPRYVSTVDSGNLAGHLVTLASTLREWARAPALALLSDLSGAVDALGVLRGLHRDARPERRMLRPLHARIGEWIDGLSRSLLSAVTEPHMAPALAHDYALAARGLDDLIKVLQAEAPGPASDELAWWSGALVRCCTQAAAGDSASLGDLGRLSGRMEALAETARRFAFEMNFAFLYVEEKRLFTIGYRIAEGEQDGSCYDLLASEARLSSLFAIGKGDVPTEHWGRLGRQMVAKSHGNALVSWSGCLFEYLMAPLVMEERPGSVLHESGSVAIETQIRSARRQGLPWGVSESAYNARDAEMNYQYFAFGDPALALRRWRKDERVVAPYATFLAAPFRPRTALANLKRLAALGARGLYGFYDAIDFTPARVPDGMKGAVVRTFMAHHQGICLLAVANCLLNGVHRRRFHADPVIESVSSLLQQRAPREVSPVSRQMTVVETEGRSGVVGPAVVEVADAAAAPDIVALMSNGRQSLLVNARGSGRARIGRTDITRWRPDPVEDIWGEFLFLRDEETGAYWSATPAPVFDPDTSYSARFHDFKAEFTATGHDIVCQCEIIQADDLDARGCRVRVRNLSGRKRDIDLVSFAEIALDDIEADRAHTAFSRMFIATEARPRESRIFARRNKRKPSDPDLHLVHFITGAGATLGAQTDRYVFLGRGGSIGAPRALRGAGAFDDHARGEDFTLDPIMSLLRRLRLQPGKEAVVEFWTVTADSRGAVEAAAAVLSQPDAFERQHHMAWTRSQVQLHHAGIDPAEAALFRRYASLLGYPSGALARGPGEGKAGPQSLLWPLSISGDRPIFLLRIDDPTDLPIMAQAVRMQEYFRMRGLDTDLVILNEQRASYSADLQNAINAQCQGMQLINARPYVFTVEANRAGAENLQALLAAAGVVIHAQNGPLFEQIDRLQSKALDPRIGNRPLDAVQANALMQDFPAEELRFWNGKGGFDSDGNYVVRLRHGEATPQPWINVIARSDFGFHISAEGAAYSWSLNSRDHQLTPWSNDFVANPMGEGILLRDRATGALHTPYAGLSTQEGALYECRHGAGWTRFRSWSGPLEIEALHSLAPEGRERIVGLRLKNRGAREMALDVGHFLMPVMGGSRARTAAHLELDYDRERRMILCRNPYSIDYPGALLTLSVDARVSGVCLSRPRWQGRNRSPSRPCWYDMVASGKVVLDTDSDPLMMLETMLTLYPGEQRELTFRLGADDAPPSLASAREGAAAQEREWRDIFAHVEVETPDPAFDLMVNRWLPYQALACRIRARSAFYQASGAYGFRDQLQDTSAMLIYDPALARAQLCNAAGRQFVEGDVQHWWLPGSGAGVRTMIADDVVWLGHMLARYVTVTGDRSILDENIAFLTGRALEPGEHDAFFTPEQAEESATLYDHAARALDLAIARTGAEGLPLFLGGDWNDGMNRVGEGGRGQSVWLGWFLFATLAMMEPIARSRGEEARADMWTAHRQALSAALDHVAWDGHWYLRGLYDDGTPLGSHLSEECRIDSIAQSWSVISGAGRPDRQAKALDAALAALEDREVGIARLFTPPFQHEPRDPGYIRGYPPGVRENGGQYTHAAIWLVQALSLAGRAEDAWRIFDMLNPINHSRDPASAQLYRGEPYVIAADVYGEGAKSGRAGWTWYTGSAGWLHRVAVEHILGIGICDGKELTVVPGIPAHWPGYKARIRMGDRRCAIEVTRGGAGGDWTVTIS